MKTKNYFLVRLAAFVLMCALFIGIIPASATESFNGVESTGIESGVQPEETIEEIEEIIEDSELPEPKIIEDENGTQWILGPEISSDLESEMLENSELSEETVHAKRGAKAGATYTVTTLSSKKNLGVYFDQAITFRYDKNHTGWTGYDPYKATFDAGDAEQPKYITETIKETGSTASYVAYCANPELPSLVGEAGYTAATSEQAWTKLYTEQKEAIALAIAYGFNGAYAGHQLISPNSPTADERTKINNVGSTYGSYPLFSHEPATADTISKKGYYLNAEQYLATQLIIWEIVTGCRECRSANTTNQYGLVSSDKNSGAKFSESKYATVRYAYDKIDRLLYAHTKVPSYAKEFEAAALTYSADKGTDGTWRYTLSDANAVSDMYDVTPVDPVLRDAWNDTSKIKHSVSGDHKTLWITIVDSAIAARLDGGGNALFKAENKARKLVTGNSSAVIALQARSGVTVGGKVQPQPVASLPESSIKSDPKTGYFKLRANGVTNESYKISIQKVDPNGNPLSGAALKLQKQNVSYTTGRTTLMCASSTVYYSNIATGVNKNTLLRILDYQNKECPFTCYNSYVVITGRYVQGDDYTFEYQKNAQTTWSDVASWTSTTSAKEFSDPSWLVIPGTYRLVETSAPSGYQVIDPIEFSFTSSDAGRTKTITAVDPYITRPVTIQKSYSCTSEVYSEKIEGNPLYSLSGAVFEIRSGSATGPVQETIETNANGEAVSTGKYAVGTVLYAVETTAPAGYKTASPVSLTVTSNSANNIFRVNDPPVFNTFNTTLQKVDSTKALQGAVFKYSYYTNHSGTGSPARVWYFRSDASGNIKYDTSHLASGYSSSSLFTSGTIPLGRIVVEEVAAPSGYSLNTTSKAIYDITQASAGANATGTWTAGSGMFSYNSIANLLTATNQPLYLKIYKKIAAGSSGDVTGWQFKVYQGSTLIGTYTTNTTETVGGSVCGVVATNLPAGTYRIEEVAKTGWVAQSSQTVTVTNSNTSSNPATVTFVNQQTPYLKIYKKIAAGSSGDVTGWQFKVYQGNALIGTYTTNTTETVGGSVCGVIATNIAAGTYRIEEVAKNGWVAQPSQNVTITSSNTPSNPATVTFTNEQTKLKIQKTFASGSTGSLVGWGFLQFPANYNTSNVVAVESFISTDGRDDYQDIGQDEQFHNPVWEIFHIYINGEEIGFSNNNYKDGMCVFDRAPNIGDTVTVVFATVNAANYVNLGVTNTSGQIVRNANAGTYTIVEVPQFGYVQQSPKTVTVTNSNTASNPATVTFVNQREPNFKIYKSIAANSTGSAIGWQFKVYQRSTLINTYTTTQTEVINGVTYGVITTFLPVGIYRVEEVAKDGWVAQPAQTVVVTNANAANNPASVSFENEKLSVHLEKQYTESGLSDGYSMVTFLSSENQNLLGEHCYSTVTVSLTQNISAASASSDIYIGTDRLTDRSRSTNTIAYRIKTSGEPLVRYIPEAVCYVLHNGRLLEPGRDWYVTTSDINHIRFASTLSAGDTVQIIYLTQTVDGNATIHHITSDNAVDAHNLTANITYWFYEIPVPGYRANGDNPQSIQLHGNDNGQLTFINEPDVCGISIEKTTSDGSSVEGWAFNIYRDGDISRYDACTFNGTGAAAYNIPSISNDNHIDDVFAVYVNNSWYDNRHGDMFTYSKTTGMLTFLKAIPQPSDTVQIVYTRENYDNPYNDDPYITDEHGLITDDDLPEGIYNVEEIPTLGYLYQPPVTGVEVVAGQITAVDFHNVPTDTDIRIEKSFKDGTYGNKQGWEFAVIDVDEFCDLGVDHVFMMDSFIYDSATYSEDLSRMLPGHPNVCGIYSVYRNGTLLSDGHDYQVQGGELDIGLASVENGDEITVVYSPVIDMNYLYHSPNYHIISTNQYGIANVKNLTGEWFVEEIPQYGYLQQPVQDVSVYSKTTEYLNFENTRLAKIQVKKTDTSGYPLEGVQFILQYKGIHEDTWHDAVYSASRNGAAGTFYTDNNINNNKTILTDTNGCASFNCIAASTAYEYRLVETATTTDRNGRQLSLLAQPIEIGVLPKALEFSSSAELQTWLSQQNNVSDYVVNGNSVMQYTLHYTIANGGVTQMPFTGSTEMEKTVLTGSIMLAFAAGMLFIVCRKKREQE